MDVQGVIPAPVEDIILLFKWPFIRRSNRKRDKKIEEVNKWPKISILMAQSVKEDTNVEGIKRAVKSIFKDDYPKDKIDLIIIANGENSPDPIKHPHGKKLVVYQDGRELPVYRYGEKDVVHEKREEIEDALKECKCKVDEGEENLFNAFNKVTLVENHKNVGNKAIPLNVGLTKASEEPEYVLTIDPDGIIKEGSLKRLIAHFLMDKDKKVGAVGGTITIREGCQKKERKQNLFTKWDFLTAEHSTRLLRNVYSPYLYHVSGGISAFRKKILDKIGQNNKTSHFIDGVWTTNIPEVYHESSVTEDHELTEQVLDLGKKVVHEADATYCGLAPNSFREQKDRFRRWYGGYSQDRKIKRRLNCKSTFWSRLSRGWRAFSTIWYSFFWLFILFLFLANLFLILKGRGIFPLISENPLWRQFTFIGGIWSVPDSIYSWSVKPLSWWFRFHNIYLAEVSLCICELLLTLPVIRRKKIEKGLWSLLSFIPYALFLPFVIIFVNRIYWILFFIYGRVSHKKLAW